MTKDTNAVFLNDLIGFVVDHIPGGDWMIELCMTSRGASLTLYDTDGDHVEVCTDDMDSVAGVIEHLNHARRACGLADVKFPATMERDAEV